MKGTIKILKISGKSKESTIKNLVKLNLKYKKKEILINNHHKKFRNLKAGYFKIIN